MALSDLPIPPELAVETEPIDERELLLAFEHAQQLADEASIDFHAALDMLSDNEADAQSVAARVGRWRIEDDEAAEWAMRKLLVAHDEIQRLSEQAQEWERRIRHWFVQTAASHERTRLFMEQRLLDYGLRRREAGGAATLPLPSGTIRTTSSKPAVEVVDDVELYETISSLDADRLDAWSKAMANAALSSSDLTHVTPKVYVAALRKLTQIVEKPDGNELTIEFACGHVITYDFLAEQRDVPERGEVMGCAQCPKDPISDELTQQPVARAELTPLVRVVVIGPDGIELPGVSVKPASVKASVQL